MSSKDQIKALNKESKDKIKAIMKVCKAESKAISDATNKLIKDLKKAAAKEEQSEKEMNDLIKTFNKVTVNPLDKKLQKAVKRLANTKMTIEPSRASKRILNKNAKRETVPADDQQYLLKDNNKRQRLN